jgi:hypothetical protein
MLVVAILLVVLAPLLLLALLLGAERLERGLEQPRVELDGELVS